MEASQNDVKGMYQTKTEFWGRVSQLIAERSNSTFNRPERSNNIRMSAIMAEIKKLKGCVRQVEHSRISGANDKIIVRI